MSPEFRRGFLAPGVPIFMSGIGGPRAPHQFDFDRRCNLSDSAADLACWELDSWCFKAGLMLGQ